MGKLLRVVAALSLGVSASFAADEMATTHVVFTTEAIQWGDAPPVLPAGAKMAVLKGDPAEEGIFTARLLMPAGYKIMPHWHPASENVTVMSGTAWLGTGSTFDKTRAQKLPPGSYTSIPPRHQHFAWAETECVIQLTAMGPWQLYYINPDDDPQAVARSARK